MTPAQEAKQYARDFGFVIGTIPAMKRYTVNVLKDGVSAERIAEVGGYPAALNAMKRYVEAEMQKQIDDADAEVRALGNNGAADSQCAESVVGAADISPMSALHDHVAIVDTPPNPDCFIEQQRERVYGDKRGMPGVDFVPDAESNNRRWEPLKGNPTPRRSHYVSPCDFPFDDLQSRERIRAAARERRTGYYVRVRDSHGEIMSDIYCGSLNEAYHTSASAAQAFKRARVIPFTTREIIFKRG